MTRHVLIISGLDPSGGAGFIADVRVVTEHGLRPVGVVSALTEQDTAGVRAVEVVAPSCVEAQLLALLSDVEIAAVKIGMLGDEAVCQVIAAALELTAAPVVWDPIVRPTRGGVPLFRGSVTAAAELLADHLSLITPNIPEASVLCDMTIDSVEAMHTAAAELNQRIGCAVLVTGGHLRSSAAVVDVLADSAGVRALTGERVVGGEHTHGTGCALSTAIACGLAKAESYDVAIVAAKSFVSAKLAVPIRAGRGSPSIV